MVLSVATVLVTTPVFVAPDMPCGLAKALTVIFDDIQLHTNGRLIGLDVAIA